MKLLILGLFQNGSFDPGTMPTQQRTSQHASDSQMISKACLNEQLWLVGTYIRHAQSEEIDWFSRNYKRIGPS